MTATPSQSVEPPRPLLSVTVTGVFPATDVALTSSYEEIAGFANATWHATKRLDLAFGGRLSHNKQVASQVSDGVLAGGHTQYDDVKSSESPFTYSVAPRFAFGEVEFGARFGDGPLIAVE